MGSSCADAWRCSQAVSCASGSLDCSTYQQAGAAGGGAAAAAAAAVSSANEASSFGTAVDQGHKSLAEMRQERQVHPNMESIFRRTHSSPSALPSAANSAAKDADLHEEEICKCVDCACIDFAFGGLERGCGEDN